MITVTIYLTASISNSQGFSHAETKTLDIVIPENGTLSMETFSFILNQLTREIQMRYEEIYGNKIEEFPDKRDEQ